MRTPLGGSSPTVCTAIWATSSTTGSRAFITPATPSCTRDRPNACARWGPTSRFFRSMAAITSATRRFLASVGLPDHDLGELPDSAGRFPDGAHYRVEIPSTEGPLAFEAVLD